MCYNARYLLEKALKRAIFYGVTEDIERFKRALKKFNELYQVSGFSHPEVIIYKNDQPHEPSLAQWGLIPHWIKTEKEAKTIWNKTINARGESIFEKPAFKDSATHKRCLIPVAGFFEHHHFKGKAYPFYISRIDEEPLTLAGLWSEWTDNETGEIIRTCSVITTKANPLMAKIHNNPKLSEARMPVILPEELENEWLKPIQSSSDIKQLQELLRPFPEEKLKAHTVQKLSGKNALGNVPESSDELAYEALNNSLSLF